MRCKWGCACFCTFCVTAGDGKRVTKRTVPTVSNSILYNQGGKWAQNTNKANYANAVIGN